jgi:hypothetical protein
MEERRREERRSEIFRSGGRKTEWERGFRLGAEEEEGGKRFEELIFNLRLVEST